MKTCKRDAIAWKHLAENKMLFLFSPPLVINMVEPPFKEIEQYSLNNASLYADIHYIKVLFT